MKYFFNEVLVNISTFKYIVYRLIVLSSSSQVSNCNSVSSRFNLITNSTDHPREGLNCEYLASEAIT